ncbi:MAG: alpha/beta fold hydrolase [Pseudomonadales bacterium]
MSLLGDEATRLVEAGGLTFACQVHGDSHGPSIFLIRGLGTQLIEWSPVLVDALVAGGLRVVAFDNRDAGRSSRLDHDYPLSDMADDVVALADALGIDRFHVLGISLGGMVAQLVAVRHPERVLCLCSVMSTTGNPDLPRSSAAVRGRLTASAASREGRIRLDAENRAIWGSPGYPESEADRLRAARVTYDRCHYPEGVARQMGAVLADGSRVARLAGIRARTLVIHGADDVLILPDHGADTARAIPGAEFQLVPGMGHNIPDALAPDLARRVLDFLHG